MPIGPNPRTDSDKPEKPANPFLEALVSKAVKEGIAQQLSRAGIPEMKILRGIHRAHFWFRLSNDNTGKCDYCPADYTPSEGWVIIQNKYDPKEKYRVCRKHIGYHNPQPTNQVRLKISERKPENP